MIVLRQGDHLPTVAVAQSFLNQHLPRALFLTVDGVFGTRTATAVAHVRSKLRIGHGPAIDGVFWLALVGIDWQVLDSTDLTDPDLQSDLPLAPYGQTVRRQYGQSNGTPGVLDDIMMSAAAGKLALLRFHGHGNKGGMIVAAGEHNNGSFMDHRVPRLFVEPFRRIATLLAPFASIEMHGCKVAAGPGGLMLLTQMANAAQVPVTAGIRAQLGNGDYSFRFQGPTRTVLPMGGTIKDWADRVLNVSRPAASMSMVAPPRIKLAKSPRKHAHH